MISCSSHPSLPMAGVKHGSWLANIRGKFGDCVVKHYAKGKIVVTRAPTFTKGWSKDQKSNRGRFSKASDYAKAVQRSPEKLASYALAAKKLKQTVRSVAMSDFLSEPTLRKLDLSNYSGDAGDRIGMRTAKRFKVTRVDVVIRTDKGKLLDQGPAETNLSNRTLWSYAVSKKLRGEGAIVIEAKAQDRFGRTATLAARKTI